MVRLWCKGFFSVVFLQGIQIFVLTTLPLILPSLPEIPGDNQGVMQGLLLQFPLILTLSVMLLVPRMLGTSADKAFGTVSSMTGGVITAVSAATSLGR